MSAESRQSTEPLFKAPFLLAVAFGLSAFGSFGFELLAIRRAFIFYGIGPETLAVILSCFMLGLGGGALLAIRLKDSKNLRFLYVLCELILASASTVGFYLVTHAGDWSWSVSSARLFLFASLLPFTMAMGATLPLGVSIVEVLGGKAEFKKKSYTFYALANLGGSLLALVGVTLVFVEALGVRGAWHLGALAHLASLGLVFLAFQQSTAAIPTLLESTVSREMAPQIIETPKWRRQSLIAGALGLISLGLESYWAKLLTPYLGPSVYTFAIVLGAFLLGSFLGSFALYQNIPQIKKLLSEDRFFPIWLLVSVLSLSIGSAGLMAVFPHWCLPLLGIIPYSFVSGYGCTWILEGDWSQKRFKKSYGLNVLGSALGPLLLSFFLLPYLSHTQIGACFVGLILLTAAIAGEGRNRFLVLGALASIVFFSLTPNFEESLLRESQAKIKKEANGWVLALEDKSGQKRLYVNGFETTIKTFVTKDMGHLPFFFFNGEPKQVLNICFGMGTTFRSMQSWARPILALDLFQGVFDFFPFFYPIQNTAGNTQMIAQDARYFLQRSQMIFDIVSIDPPPPVESAYSSLLYSKEFYGILKARLSPNAIVHQWVPESGGATFESALRAVIESFSFVRIFHSRGGLGFHILGSQKPLLALDQAALLKQTPQTAKADFMEWAAHGEKFENSAQALLSQEMPLDLLLGQNNFGLSAITDDNPVNEFYFVRRYLRPLFGVPSPDANEIRYRSYAQIALEQMNPADVIRVYQEELRLHPDNTKAKAALREFCRKRKLDCI